MSTQPQTQPTPQELALAGILATLASGAVLTAPLALGAAGALGVPAAAILAAFKIAGSVPLPPMPAGQAARHASAVNVAFRVHFIAAAARRLAAGGSLQAERDNLRLHLQASQARTGAAVAVDSATVRWGPVLGWQAVGDRATTAGCRAASGSNFDPRRPPVIEGVPVLPGFLHSGRCRCRPVAPFSGARILS